MYFVLLELFANKVYFQHLNLKRNKVFLISRTSSVLASLPALQTHRYLFWLENLTIFVLAGWVTGRIALVLKQQFCSGQIIAARLPLHTAKPN